MNAQRRGQQNIHVACFDFLDRADVEVDQFGELLLRQSAAGAHATYILSECSQLLLLNSREGHAPLRRGSSLTRTAQRGVIVKTPRLQKAVAEKALVHAPLPEQRAEEKEPA